MSEPRKKADDFSFDSSTSAEISRAIAQKRNRSQDSAPRRSSSQGNRNPSQGSHSSSRSSGYSRDNDDRRRTAPAGKKRRKKKSSAAPAVIAVVALVVLLGAGYLAGWSSSMGTFLKNTYIDDEDVSGMTTIQAINLLKDKYTAPKVTISTRSGNVVTIDLAEYGYSVDVSAAIKEIYNKQDHSKWFLSFFNTSEYELETDYSFDKDHFERQLRRTTWSTFQTTDAHIEYGDSGYYIVPEVYGDDVDIDKLVDYVEGCIGKGQFKIDISDADLYSNPRVTEKDLLPQLNTIKDNFDFVITYDFDYTQEYLTGREVYNWTKANGEVDRKKAEAFVDQLAQKYDTFMTTRNFNTTERGPMQISQGRYSTGQYGWWIDQEKTVDKLMEHIEEGKSITIDPVYVQLDTGYTYEGFAPGRSADGDIGNTYIEIDLSAQHLWYYQEGELKFETLNIVSGKATDPSRKTPGGIYSVYTKSTNYTMVAPDNSYRAKCAYFMRLSFEGIGLHDLSRGAYGGNTYINNGSHGCINMKYAEVKQLYDMVERGTPVIMYY